MRLAGWLLAVVLAGCSKDKGVETKTGAPAHSDEPEHSGLPTKITLAPNVVLDAKILTAPVTREVLATTIGLAGEIVADPDNSARVSSPVAGHIETVDFKEGMKVKKGDTLATLRVPDLGKLRGAFAATAAKARTARSNADRMKALLEQRLTSEQASLNASAEADALEAEANAQSQQLHAMGVGGSAFLLTLRAPITVDSTRGKSPPPWSWLLFS